MTSWAANRFSGGETTLPGGEWDVLYLSLPGETDTRPLPGVARVDVRRASGLDVNKPRGAKKARVVDVGVHPAELDVELVMTADDLPLLKALLPRLSPRSANGGLQPLGIVHPNAALWGVNAVLVSEVSSPTPRANGIFALRLKLIEHVEQPKKVKKPNQAAKNDRGEWDTSPLANGLLPPSKSGAAALNFTSGDLMSKVPDDYIPGSGF